jgi:hypothetical protein
VDEKSISRLFSRKEEIQSAKSIASDVKSIMKPDRAKNIEIILKKLKLEKNFTSLKDAFLIYDANYINEELLIGLQNILPTPKERSDYQELSIEITESWTLADRYIKFACTIDSLE